jgi:hypothetical protein
MLIVWAIDEIAKLVFAGSDARPRAAVRIEPARLISKLNMDM